MRRVACLSVLLTACSASLDAVDPEVPGESGALPGDNPEFDPNTLPEVQPAPGAPLCDQGQGISQVRGRVQDDSGLSVVGAKVQLCVNVAGNDTLVCLRPVDSDQTGTFAVAVPAEAGCVTSGAIRVIQVGAAAATTYCELPMTPISGVVSIARPLVITRTTAAVSIPEGGGTVTFAGGVSVDVDDPNRLFGADDGYNSLGMRVVDPNGPGVCRTVTDPLAFDGMLAFSPEMDVDGAGLNLRIQTDLAPLTPVAMFVKGGLNCSLPDGTHPAEAEWVDFGTGIVDEEGVLHATGENGLPCLGWLAFFALDGPDGSRLPPRNEGAPPPLPEPMEEPPVGEDNGGGDAIPPPADPPEDPPPPTEPPENNPPNDPPPPPPPPEPEVECNPPAGNPGFSNGGIIPPFRWDDAYDANGNPATIDLGQMHCDESIKAFVFVISAGWCSACPSYLRDVARQAPAIVDAGGVIIWMEAEDNSYNPANSRVANQLLNRYINNAPGFRAGDASTIPSRGMANSRIIRQFPTAFVVQRSDMRIIADLASGGGWGIDFVSVIRNAR